MVIIPLLALKLSDIKALYQANPSIYHLMESQFECILLEWNHIITGALQGEQKAFHAKLQVNNRVGCYVRSQSTFNITEHFMNLLVLTLDKCLKRQMH